jgi:hypothetical protein
MSTGFIYIFIVDACGGDALARGRKGVKAFPTIHEKLTRN